MNILKIQKRDYVIVAVILIVAAIVRVVKLDSSLWYDEIVTLVEFIRLPFVDLLSNHSSFNNHPFYSLLAKASVLLFGESTWSIRLPAVFFGVAGIAAMWRLAYAITGSLQAHVCALLLALSYHHVWFSQNARGYTELMFWCVVSTLILIDGIRSPTWKRWIVYGAVIAAGIYTHLTAALFFLAQVVIVCIFLFRKNRACLTAQSASMKQQWLMPVIGFLTAGILILLLYSPSLVQLFDSVMYVPNTSSADVMKEYQSPVWAALEIVRSFALPGPATSLVVLASGFLAAIGMHSVFHKEPLVPVLLVLHVIMMLSALMALSMRIWPRFFFIDIGFVLLFVVQGVFVCCQQVTIYLKRKGRLEFKGESLFVLSSALMVAISSVLLLRNYQFPKQDFDSSIRYISERRMVTDNVVTLGLAVYPYRNYYLTDWLAIEDEEELGKIESEATRTWLVIIFPARTTRKYPGIMEYVDANYSLAKTFRGTLGDGNILVFARNSRF